MAFNAVRTSLGFAKQIAHQKLVARTVRGQSVQTSGNSLTMPNVTLPANSTLIVYHGFYNIDPFQGAGDAGPLKRPHHGGTEMVASTASAAGLTGFQSGELHASAKWGNDNLVMQYQTWTTDFRNVLQLFYLRSDLGGTNNIVFTYRYFVQRSMCIASRYTGVDAVPQGSGYASGSGAGAHIPEFLWTSGGNARVAEFCLLTAGGANDLPGTWMSSPPLVAMSDGIRQDVDGQLTMHNGYYINNSNDFLFRLQNKQGTTPRKWAATALRFRVTP